MPINILFEDSHILVCEKPAGIPVQTKNPTMPDIITQLRNYLAEKTVPQKSIPYIGVIHRLDQFVGGIMVFAKNKKAAASLNQQFSGKTAKKQYLAIITANLSNQKGKKPCYLKDYMITDKKQNISRICKPTEINAKEAILSYEFVAISYIENTTLSLLKINLYTGRQHQIRLQTATHLGGIWGDKKYNTLFQNTRQKTLPGLYAYKLEFIHPITKKNMHFKKYPNFDIFKLFQHE